MHIRLRVLFILSLCVSVAKFDDCLKGCADAYFGKQIISLLGKGFRHLFINEVTDKELVSDVCEKTAKGEECMNKCNKRIVYSDEMLLAGAMKHECDSLKPVCGNIEEAIKSVNCWDRVKKDQKLEDSDVNLPILTKIKKHWQLDIYTPTAEYEAKCSMQLDMLKKIVPTSRSKCGDAETELGVKVVKESFLSFSNLKGIKVLPKACQELVNFTATPWYSRVWNQIFG
ncbi:hypothetical protein DdX_11719 [Ditylenchus destructor]|uniref:Uncharacterized protein n=1 Tax=Ditylenchus destructor TaxID=166010 RepID=A0AAD4R4B8_9BILA|nr:hypothetical protein DdX_11719 [Ditylenchus destructor]